VIHIGHLSYSLASRWRGLRVWFLCFADMSSLETERRLFIEFSPSLEKLCLSHFHQTILILSSC